MAYTEYNLIILSHIVVAKFSITSRNIMIAIDFPCKLVVCLAGMASLTRTTMYASTWGMAERICREDKEPVASFGEFAFNYD
jgi:hypothetical protein